jgi:hypothetical protein
VPAGGDKELHEAPPYLRILADFLDDWDKKNPSYDPNKDESQNDLRKWADDIEKLYPLEDRIPTS